MARRSPHPGARPAKRRAAAPRRQYSIRIIPDDLDQALRQESRRQGRSLNDVVLEALRRGVGIVRAPRVYNDLDALIGTWVEDPEFDRVMEAQRQVDPEVWA